MRVQKSFQEDSSKLYLVATPIGNLDDITFRAVKILQSVDVVFAEDTRVSSKLLYNHLNIKVRVESYHEHNKHFKGEKIIEFLENGSNVALISDAGMPCISDPGYEIVKNAIESGYDVVPIPGASASLTALIASGLETEKFCFFGFLDRNKNKRIKQLENVGSFPYTLIFYEAPHRIKGALEDIYAVLGDRKIVLARELTKKFEEFRRGSVSEFLNEDLTLKGEMVLIVEGNDEKKSKEEFFEKMTILEHIKHYQDDGVDSKDAIKKVAKDRGLNKNEVYKVYHDIDNKKEVD